VDLALPAWLSAPHSSGPLATSPKGQLMPEDPESFESIGLYFWQRSTSGKFTKVGAKLADSHYSRRKIGSPQFMPPGETVVLVSVDRLAVFGWWRPHPSSGLKQMNGLDGWTCSIFRNTSTMISSWLIVDAERALLDKGCGESGLITYVFDSKIRSVNPGCCFKKAGWHVAGRCERCASWRPRSADGKKTLLHKPYERAGQA
jgi:hypothetical protein